MRQSVWCLQGTGHLAETSITLEIGLTILASIV